MVDYRKILEITYMLLGNFGLKAIINISVKSVESLSVKRKQ